MIDLRFNEQELIPEKFKRLSTKEKHAYAEKKMGDRIMLTYNQALRECRDAIASDEKLTQAFQNFQNLKNCEVQHIDPLSGNEILTGAYVDKFKEKIFLVTYKHIHRYYQYVYDVPSKELLLYESNGKYTNDLPSDLSNIVVYYSANIGKTFKEIWQKTNLCHVISIRDVIRSNGNISNEYNLRVENQEYKNDNFYSRVNKNFKPLEKYEEINECFPSGHINSYFNPSHSTIDPEDLINYQESNSAVSECSA